MGELRIRTAAWYGDDLLNLPVPQEWRITTVTPRTPPPLSEREIARRLESSVGQPPIRSLCRATRRPLVVIDDLNRPTPVASILRVLLDYFREASIEPAQLRILIATGTHPPPDKDAIARKLGSGIAGQCQVKAHDPRRDVVRAGSTSFGTPILVNREVLDSDLVIGIGGVYPNHSAGFGGGSKLALGVLGFRSILHLHYRHRPAGWGCEVNSFRADLDEIARAIGLRTMISAYVNADRELVHLICGDHFLYYPDAVEFARNVYAAPEPTGADVVISNAFPSDLSLTFAKMKGFGPLGRCAAGASRIAIAACTRGFGAHDLFPIDPSKVDRARELVRWASVRSPAEIVTRLAARVRQNGWRVLADGRTRTPPKSQRPIHMYRPGAHGTTLSCPGLVISESWPDIIRAVEQEQFGRQALEVYLYPCAALQYFDRASARPIAAPQDRVALGS